MCPTVGHISTFSEEETIIKPKQTDFHSVAPMWAALSAAVVWLAAIAAYAYEDGMNLFQWTGRFSQVLERPFSIGWMPHTLKFIACALLPFFRSGEKRKLSAGMIVGTMGNGILGCVANLLLLISLAHLPASAQYPFVTGGVMIMSTALCFFTSKKPRARELVSVALAFAGMLALVLID